MQTRFGWYQWWWILASLFLLLVAIGVRWYRLDSLPPAPYWEEVALGYDAWSLATTGKDHHGQAWPLVAAESFGDYKPTGYMYALIPFVKIGGLNVWTVRMPSATAGVVTVGLIGWLLAWVAPAGQRRWWWLVGLAVAAVAPWGIWFSRGAWEVNLATMWLTLGVATGLMVGRVQQLPWRWARRPNVWLVISVSSLWLAWYTYHAARIIGPAVGLLLVGYWWHRFGRQTIRSCWRGGAVAVVVTLLALVPILQTGGGNTLTRRWAETGLSPTSAMAEITNAHQDGRWWNKILYHRFVLLTGHVIEQYLAHWRLDFLFVDGDTNARHSLPFTGVLYYLDGPLILMGLWWLSRRWRSEWFVIIGWGLVSLLPAALATPVPHALRILPSWPVWIMLVSVGVVQVVSSLSEWLKAVTWLRPAGRRRIVSVVMTLAVAAYLAQFGVWWRYYTLVYPQLYSQDWQYGYQQVIAAMNDLHIRYPDQRLYITRQQGRPAMYVWFYSQTPPTDVQQADISAKQDLGEFLEFQHWTFVRTTAEVHGPALVAADPVDGAQLQQRLAATLLSQIKSSKGEVIWNIYEIN